MEPFKNLFQVTTKLREADVCLFTGGEDVTPSMYGQAVGCRTFSSIDRDRREALIFAQCEDMGIAKLGICRGSQFLTVMSGGSLIQDVTNHAIGSMHEVICEDGRVRFFTSTHHQMMNPFNVKEFKLLGWSEGISKHYLDGENKNNSSFAERGIEPEIVWYPKTQALCFQPHPEMMADDSKGVEYTRKLIKQYLLKG